MNQATINSVQRVAADRQLFNKRILIDTSKGPRCLAEVLEPWQEADEAAIEPSIQAIINGDTSNENVKRRVYLERPRGHDKTSAIARVAIRTLAARKAPGSGVWVASDRDQAALGREAIRRLLTFNPPLQKFIDAQRDKIVFENGSQLDIISSDAGSAYGRLDDLIIADEITHWKENAEPLWQALYSTAPKRNSLVFIIANSGYMDTWPWRIREAARQSPDWIFSRLEGVKASWITAKTLEEQRRFLPRMAYSRLWENLWVSAAGDAIAAEDISCSFERKLSPLTTPEPNNMYVGGLDLGVSRDWSAFVVIGKAKDGRVRVAQVHVWKPPPGGKVPLDSVASAIFKAHETFKLRAVAADPSQAHLMIQQLQKQGVRISERPQTGARLQEQADAVIEVFSSRQIDCIDDPRLRFDLEHLRLEARSYGWRLCSDRGPEGHGDIASGLSIALAAARSLKPTRQFAIGVGGQPLVGGHPPAGNEYRPNWHTGHRGDFAPEPIDPATIGPGHVAFHSLHAALNAARLEP